MRSLRIGEALDPCRWPEICILLVPKLKPMKRLVALIFAATSALAVAQLPDYVPTEGLVAWYSFDSTLIDSGPNGNDGQSESYVFAQDVFGMAAGALRLELGEYVNLGMENRLLNTGQDSLSIAFWSKPDENGEIIISKYVNFDAAQSSWLIRDGESTGVRAIGNGEDGNDAAWNLSCPNGTPGWSHIAIVYHPGKVFVWVNGNFICESPVPNSDVTNPQPILVGRSNCNGAFCNDASGLIDNLGFWDRALTATEVQQIASGTPPTGCTDSDACNFNEDAVLDDGSCSFITIKSSVVCNVDELVLVEALVDQFEAIEVVQVDGYDLIGTFGESQYLLSQEVFDAPEGWNSQNAIAESFGGHLADIHSQEENDFIAGSIQEGATTIYGAGSTHMDGDD